MPIWGIFGGRVGGRGIPQMACESLPLSFRKGGEVCFVFLTGNFRRFPQNGVGSYKLPYLIRKGLGECWKLLVDGGGGLNYNDYIIHYKNNDVYKFKGKIKE